jgi:hypothetical protein
MNVEQRKRNEEKIKNVNKGTEKKQARNDRNEQKKLYLKGSTQKKRCELEKQTEWLHFTQAN